MRLIAITLLFAAAAAAQTREYYDEAGHYRIRVPAGFRIEKAPTETRFWSADRKLAGTVTVAPNARGESSKALLRQALLDRAPALDTKYQVAKIDLFAFSGELDANIVYEKAILGESKIKRLDVEYPISERPRFDAIVSELAKGFEEVEVATGKAYVIAADPGTVHAAWIETASTNDDEKVKVCYFGEKDAAQWSEVPENTVVTVEGKPALVQTRNSSKDLAGVFQYQITQCVLRKKLP